MLQTALYDDRRLGKEDLAVALRSVASRLSVACERRVRLGARESI